MEMVQSCRYKIRGFTEHVIYMVNSTSPLSKLRHTRYGTYTYVAGELGVLVLGIDTPDNPN